MWTSNSVVSPAVYTHVTHPKNLTDEPCQLYKLSLSTFTHNSIPGIAGSVGSVSTQHLQQDKSELHSVLHRFPSLVHLITLMPSNRKGERVAGLPQSMARVSVWQVNFSDLCRRVALICRHRYQILHRLLTRLSELCCSSVFWREEFFFQTSFCYLCFICRLSFPSGATFAFVPEQAFLIFENVHLSNDITCWSSR